MIINTENYPTKYSNYLKQAEELCLSSIPRIWEAMQNCKRRS
jgi:hypothetical protein